MKHAPVRRHVLGGALGLTALVGATVASPAEAADTTSTFTLSGGSLSISAPASAALGSAATGSATLAGSLGAVTVTDARGALLGTWTASASSSDFTTGLASPAETIGKANVAYTPGVATSTTGVGVFAGTPAASMTGTHTVFAGTGVTGNNSATWNPQITITLPSAAVAGTYSGTITHSVS